MHSTFRYESYIPKLTQQKISIKKVTGEQSYNSVRFARDTFAHDQNWTPKQHITKTHLMMSRGNVHSVQTITTESGSISGIKSVHAWGRGGND